ncbi:hypothetical protein CBL_09113 [Carabus blaptoides fortunei]
MNIIIVDYLDQGRGPVSLRATERCSLIHDFTTECERRRYFIRFDEKGGCYYLLSPPQNSEGIEPLNNCHKHFMRTHISLNPSKPRNILCLNRTIDSNTHPFSRSFVRRQVPTGTILYPISLPFPNDDNFDGLSSGHGR